MVKALYDYDDSSAYQYSLIYNRHELILIHYITHNIGNYYAQIVEFL